MCHSFSFMHNSGVADQKSAKGMGRGHLEFFCMLYGYIADELEGIRNTFRSQFILSAFQLFFCSSMNCLTDAK